MADDLDSTERKIRTALKLLTKMEIVTIETTKHYSIITLRNWAKYQDQETNDQQVTNTRPTLDQHPTIEEEGKKVKKVKNINLATPDGFEEWWNVYPRRQKRMDAENAWRDLNPDQELQSQMRSCIPAQIKGNEWWKDDKKQFIPLPASWIRAKRWTDQFQQVRNDSSMDSDLARQIKRDLAILKGEIR